MPTTIKYFIVFFTSCLCSFAQHNELPNAYLKEKISQFKKDPRGPYKRIRWFCKDGSVREPRDPCPDSIGGGIQHASYKEDVVAIGERHHIYFGEILASADRDAIWDTKNDHSRLKQYQIAKYLGSVDNGWIAEKSQYYRGAIQTEDEQAWGIDFYLWLLKQDDYLIEKYYLLRQSLRDIPHNNDTNLAQEIRSESKILAEEIPDFMKIRIKIHGSPDETDLALVHNYLESNKTEITAENKKHFTSLQTNMERFYAPVNFKKLLAGMQQLRTENHISDKIKNFLSTTTDDTAVEVMIPEISELLCDIRTEITSIKSSSDRLLILDFSNDLENILLKKVQDWKTNSLKEILTKIYTLSEAAAGTGLLETWEWEQLETKLNDLSTSKQLSVTQLSHFLRYARSVVEWSASRIKITYQDVVETYAGFEPKSQGFIDDRIRSSVALSLGESVSSLASYLDKETNFTNQVFDLKAQGSIRGLNPGYAKGKMIVVKGNPNNVEVNSNHIYVFQSPPSDLKPVAGILTVSEGNLVSHVQLLARNLGIPNAALSASNLNDLYNFNGKEVFYAVTPKGNVVMKLAADMTQEEQNLFTTKKKLQHMIEVPTNDIVLSTTKVLDMRSVSKADSGKLCGPKAANLGALKRMFPEQVVEGLIIPFGIFKSHMEQSMPNYSGSYWDFLLATFTAAEAQKSKGIAPTKIEDYTLAQLEILEKAILNISLSTSFVNDLKNQFKTVLGNEIGKVPVFLRSDTNMEDLEEFTGAGLNLTLFNVVNEAQILSGIKKVWASAYTERSFKWRQKYLLNPENVYPSILIIPSVDVDYSGVLITKGINVGTADDLTTAFSRGAGGAVDGQSAETWWLSREQSELLAPARQKKYIRLPSSGGTTGYYASFENNILNASNKNDIREIAQKIRNSSYANTDGAYDVELGFKDDKLWLFQIRPFVENKNAKSSAYLESITPQIDYNKIIHTNEQIEL